MTTNVAPDTLGKYQLLRPLAQGGMGWLYLARDQDGHGSEVVLKCVQARSQDDSSRRRAKMFLDEARAATLLHHENIVRVFEVGYEQGFYFLVMEWLKGWDLATVTQQLAERGDLLPLAVIVRLAIDCCQGLHAAHTCTTERGAPLDLIHRDISPANLFVTQQGIVKLLDFGVAKTSIQVNATQVGVVKGKLSYMSPEQIRCRPLDSRSDIFSLGVLLHELVAGRRLFKRTSPEAVFEAVTAEFIPPPARPPEHVPEHLVGVIMRMLQRDRDLRFPSADIIANELERGSAGLAPAKHGDVASHIGHLLDKAPSSSRSVEPTSASSSSLLPWAETVVNHLQSPSPSSSLAPETNPATSRTVTEADLAAFRPPARQSTARLPTVPVSLLALVLVGAVVGTLWLQERDVSQDVGTKHLTSEDRTVETDPKPRRTARPTASTTRTPSSPSTPNKPLHEPAREARSGGRSSLATPSRPAATRAGSSHRSNDTAKKPERRAGTRPLKATARSSRASPMSQPIPLPRTGRLTLEVQPWAVVYLGNRALGSTPLVEYELPAGRTTLKLRNPEIGLERDITVDIPEGRLLRKKVLLQ